MRDCHKAMVITQECYFGVCECRYCTSKEYWVAQERKLNRAVEQDLERDKGRGTVKDIKKFEIKNKYGEKEWRVSYSLDLGGCHFCLDKERRQKKLKEEGLNIKYREPADKQELLKEILGKHKKWTDRNNCTPKVKKVIATPHGYKIIYEEEQ